MREKSDFAATKNPAIHSGGMTGLVELSLCRGISLFQSYLLHSNNVDAAESFRSSSIASIMVAQEPWPRSSARATIGMPASSARRTTPPWSRPQRAELGLAETPWNGRFAAYIRTSGSWRGSSFTASAGLPIHTAVEIRSLLSQRAFDRIPIIPRTNAVRL